MIAFTPRGVFQAICPPVVAPPGCAAMISPIEKQIRELDSFPGRGAYVLSLYLSTGPAVGGHAAVIEQLQALTHPLWAALHERQRVELETELAAVRDYLGSMVAPPVAIALFSCSPRRYFRVVRLAREITPAAHWSLTTQTGPLHALVGGPAPDTAPAPA
jgi:hypothetical protein